MPQPLKKITLAGIPALEQVARLVRRGEHSVQPVTRRLSTRHSTQVNRKLIKIEGVLTYVLSARAAHSPRGSTGRSYARLRGNPSRASNAKLVAIAVDVTIEQKRFTRSYFLTTRELESAFPTHVIDIPLKGGKERK